MQVGLGSTAYGHDEHGHQHPLDAAGHLQGEIATRVTKQNLDAEKFAVQTLLGTPSTANLGAGIGGNLNAVA